MKSWVDGAKGEEVQKIINDNFQILDDKISEYTTYTNNFFVSSWSDGKILIPYSGHKKTNPCVHVFIKDDEGYLDVVGGYRIYENGDVCLLSDIGYEGRVVIK